MKNPLLGEVQLVLAQSNYSPFVYKKLIDCLDEIYRAVDEDMFPDLYNSVGQAMHWLQTEGYDMKEIYQADAESEQEHKQWVDKTFGKHRINVL